MITKKLTNRLRRDKRCRNEFVTKQAQSNMCSVTYMMTQTEAMNVETMVGDLWTWTAETSNILICPDNTEHNTKEQ